MIEQLLRFFDRKTENLGYIPDKPKKEDWMLGSAPVKDNIMMDGDWRKWMPEGELQKRGDRDKMACVTYSALNSIETIMNFQMEHGMISKDGIQWLENNGYLVNGKMDCADRLIALVSGTTTQGNSFGRVAEAIRKVGLTPESMLPYRKAMTWNQYYNQAEITDEMYKLGQEFLKRFTINYVRVPRRKWSMIWVDNFKSEIRRAPIQTAIHAYDKEQDGVFLKTFRAINHAIFIVAKEWFIGDSYKFRGSFIKQLVADFIFGNGIKYIINENKDMSNVKIVKKKNGNTIYFALPANSPAALMSMSANFGKVIPGVYPNKVDWDNLDLDGEVILDE